MHQIIHILHKNCYFLIFLVKGPFKIIKLKCVGLYK